MSHLKTERNAKFDTLSIERVITPVSGGAGSKATGLFSAL
jgi:hypothetical protein